MPLPVLYPDGRVVDPNLLPSEEFALLVDRVLIQAQNLKGILDRLTALRREYFEELKKGGAVRKFPMSCQDPRRPVIEEEMRVGQAMGPEGRAYSQLYRQFAEMNGRELDQGRVMQSEEHRAKVQQCEDLQKYFEKANPALFALDDEIRKLEKDRERK